MRPEMLFASTALLTSLLLTQTGMAAARSPSEVCVNAGYRAGTLAFDSCIARVQGDDPLAGLDNAKLSGHRQTGDGSSTSGPSYNLGSPQDRMTFNGESMAGGRAGPLPGGPASGVLTTGSVPSASLPVVTGAGRAFTAFPMGIGSGGAGIIMPQSPTMPTFPTMTWSSNGGQ